MLGQSQLRKGRPPDDGAATRRRSPRSTLAHAPRRQKAGNAVQLRVSLRGAKGVCLAPVAGLSGEVLEDTYNHVLRGLASRPGVLGSIYRGSQNKISNRRT